MSEPQIRIVSFAPLQIELPAGDIVPAGPVKIVLPPVRFLIARELEPLPPATRFVVGSDVSCRLILAAALPVTLLAEFVALHLDVFRTAHANLEALHLGRPEMTLEQACANNALTRAMNRSIGGN